MEKSEKVSRQDIPLPPQEEQPVEPENGQIVEILEMFVNSKEVFDFVTKKIIEQNPGKFTSQEEVRDYFLKNYRTKPLSLSKLIDSSVHRGTMRTLSFMGVDARSPRDVLKILEGQSRDESFEKKVEKGMYMGIIETYDVNWSLEKAARDVWQNFFDANGQTLDGIQSAIKESGKDSIIKIQGAQDYDWRELVHIGATNKDDDERSAGGFGEGAKILAFILLRDHGVKEIKFSSRDWEIQYYLADIPEESYNKKVRGLYVKKNRVQPVEGNSLEIVSSKESAKKDLDSLQQARQLFYSKENGDYLKPSFDNHETGGFKILPPKSSYPYTPEGHFYMAGQRINYKSRDKWETVEGLNIWTWKKVLTNDRDRGLITQDEMKKKIIPSIVESMTQDEQTKAVYDFQEYWDKGRSDDVAYLLQESIVEGLAAKGVKLKFDQKYLSNDISFFSKNRWIAEALGQKGYVICHGFLGKVGMTKVTERFQELQKHIKLEATPSERQRIGLLQQAAREMGIDGSDVKDVWVFGAENERNIFHGQYNDMFFWMARELLRGSFFDSLHTYVHEVAHKSGPHGTAQFEYELQQQIKKVQLFMSEKRELYKSLESQWDRS
jgi:hypothetical protein